MQKISAKDYYYTAKVSKSFNSNWELKKDVKYGGVDIGDVKFGFSKSLLSKKDYCKMWVADYKRMTQIDRSGYAFASSGWASAKTTWVNCTATHKTSNVRYYWAYRT